MIVELGIRVPLTNLEVEMITYDPEARERDHASAMEVQGADIVRDAGKPSASLYRETAFDRLLSSPSTLDEFRRDDPV